MYRLQNSQEQRLNVTIRKHEEEKANLKNHQLAMVKVNERKTGRRVLRIPLSSLCEEIVTISLVTISHFCLAVVDIFTSFLDAGERY